MTKTDERWHDEFMRERAIALRTGDVRKFRDFYGVWRLFGFYDGPLPESDFAVAVMMREAIVDDPMATRDEKREQRLRLTDVAYIHTVAVEDIISKIFEKEKLEDLFEPDIPERSMA